MPYPSPPAQDLPWEPPTLAESPSWWEPLVSSTQVLFEQGLADPRECEYREIELEVGSVWSGEAGQVRTEDKRGSAGARVGPPGRRSDGR